MGVCLGPLPQLFIEQILEKKKGFPDSIAGRFSLCRLLFHLHTYCIYFASDQESLEVP